MRASCAPGFTPFCCGDVFRCKLLLTGNRRQVLRSGPLLRLSQLQRVHALPSDVWQVRRLRWHQPSELVPTYGAPLPYESAYPYGQLQLYEISDSTTGALGHALLLPLAVDVV